MYILNPMIDFLIQVVNAPSHISMVVLLSSHSDCLGNQASKTNTWDASSVFRGVELFLSLAFPHPHLKSSLHCDLVLALQLLSTRVSLQGPHPSFLDHVEAQLIFKDSSETKTCPVLLNFT